MICQRIAIGDQQQIIQMDTGIEHDGDFAEMRTIYGFNLKNVSFTKIDVETSKEEVLDGMPLHDPKQ